MREVQAKSRNRRFRSLLNGCVCRTVRCIGKGETRDGLLVRHYFPEVPPRVEYELTEMGASMLPALEGFTSWIRDHWPRIEESRRVFDEAKK